MRYILIGHPLGHSVSPAIHGAAYRFLGVTAEYVLRDVPSEAGVLAEVDRIRRGEIAGANVTVPWKQVALRAADVLDESARVTRAANVLSRDPAGRVVAHNTDAWGLADELELYKTELGAVGAERDTALVVGNGGAALAAVVGCGYAGFSRVIVAARKWEASLERSAWPLAAEFEALGAHCVPLAAASWQADAARILAVVQATSAGMKGMAGGQLLADTLELHRLPRSIAYDLVYNPSVTPFLEAARAAGHLARGGLGMLVEQAARALEIWFGVRPPRAPLLEAAQTALGS
jgi:shikimate dehydrogenase